MTIEIRRAWVLVDTEHDNAVVDVVLHSDYRDESVEEFEQDDDGKLIMTPAEEAYQAAQKEQGYCDGGTSMHESVDELAFIAAWERRQGH